MAEGPAAYKPVPAGWEGTNCAKSFVTGDGVERVVEGYVAPEVGLPWLEWIKQ